MTQALQSGRYHNDGCSVKWNVEFCSTFVSNINWILALSIACCASGILARCNVICLVYAILCCRISLEMIRRFLLQDTDHMFLKWSLIVFSLGYGLQNQSQGVPIYSKARIFLLSKAYRLALGHLLYPTKFVREAPSWEKSMRGVANNSTTNSLLVLKCAELRLYYPKRP